MTTATLSFTHKGKRYEITREGLTYQAAHDAAAGLRSQGKDAVHVEVPGRGYGVAERVGKRSNPGGGEAARRAFDQANRRAVAHLGPGDRVSVEGAGRYGETRPGEIVSVYAGGDVAQVRIGKSVRDIDTARLHPRGAGGKVKSNPRKRPQGRRYRFDAEGREQPVWASKSRTASMGREEGAQAAREHRQPNRYGNLTYDEASAQEYHRMTGTWPAWYEPKTRSNPGSATPYAVLKGRDAPEPTSMHRTKAAAMAAAKRLARKHPGREIVVATSGADGRFGLGMGREDIVRGSTKRNPKQKTTLPKAAWIADMVEMGHTRAEASRAYKEAVKLGIDPTISDDLFELEAYMDALETDPDGGARRNPGKAVHTRRLDAARTTLQVALQQARKSPTAALLAALSRALGKYSAEYLSVHGVRPDGQDPLADEVSRFTTAELYPAKGAGKGPTIQRNPDDRAPCRDAVGNFVPTPQCGGGFKSQIATQTVQHRGQTWTLREAGTSAAALAQVVKRLKAQGYRVHVHAFPTEVGVYTRGRKKAPRRNPADKDDTSPGLSSPEIKALLRAWHGKRTDPHTWDEADTRLREAGIDPKRHAPVKRNPFTRHRGVTIYQTAGVARYRDPLTGQKVQVSQREGGLREARRRIEAATAGVQQALPL